ncbi:class I SAM-dependent methyltransferase [Pseudanabaena sp. Chao 1811]|uniref:class I SAM-dependent methyltransferase n=1 Tax=Pseudanabaena sp. Chao 1811 TaxID=2963092 RepID=UPI0022F388B8|nr:class I SAM-dependent methyltransferase [Pseudanabaena sp. Chao 1811]
MEFGVVSHKDMKVLVKQRLNSVLSELVQLQAKDKNYQLLQFKSLVSAYQYNHLYNLVLRYAEIGKHVLDWGCGNGHFSYFLLQSGYHTSGFSLNPCPPLNRLQSNDYYFTQGNADEPVKLPYEDFSFNTVVSVGVLEHVRETGGCEIENLKEIYRILKPDGYFICYHFPNQFSWVEALASLIPHKYHHQYRYTSGDIYKLCQQSGLEVVEIKTYGFLPRNWLGNLPPKIANSIQLAKLYNNLDNLLSKIFSPLCQNYWFVARKNLI